MIDALYEGFMEALETIMEWFMLILGGIVLIITLPFLWAYMWIYKHFIVEEE